MRTRTVVAAGGAVLALAGIAVAVLDPGASGATESPAMSGSELFVAKGCASCHDGPGTRATMEVGPALVDAPSWAGERRPGLDAEAYLTESIRAPGVFVSPAARDQWGMPLLALTDDEVDRLVAHLLGR